jgi:hypothetical protein
MVRRWRLIGYFPILYNPRMTQVLLAADSAPCVDPVVQLPPLHAPLSALHAAAAAGLPLSATVRDPLLDVKDPG